MVVALILVVSGVGKLIVAMRAAALVVAAFGGVSAVLIART